MMTTLSGKSVLLIIGGGIAAYKSLELIRLLRGQGAAVRCVMTEAARQFITPLSVASLSEDKVYGDLWSLTDESEMGHLRLAQEADLVVVAPASADLIARMAAGLADDLASTLLLATDKPVLAAPAMNVRMWNHAATRANVEMLGKRGIHFVGPNDGAMACHTSMNGVPVTRTWSEASEWTIRHSLVPSTKWSTSTRTDWNSLMYGSNPGT